MKFISNSLSDDRVLFLVTNSKGKVISSGGIKATLAGAFSFDFYCSVYGPGTYTISWIAYKGSDNSLTNPISYSTPSEDMTVTC